MVRSKLVVVGSVATVLVGLVSLSTASALSPTHQVSGGISLSPAVESFTLSAPQPSVSFPLTLTNHTTAVEQLNLSTENFSTFNDTGGVLLEGSTTSYTQKYGLASYLTLESSAVVLNPGQSQTIEVQINNRQSLEPGGHYGAILADSTSLGNAAGNKVVINQRLVSLVLLIKQGGDYYNMSLDQASDNGSLFHLPTTMFLKFKNAGNVQVVPRGLVKLVGPGNSIVAQGIINPGSAFILPESFRQLTVPLNLVGHPAQLPGRYKLEVYFQYDGLSTFGLNTISISYIDVPFIVSLVIVLGIIGSVLLRLRRASRKMTAKKP